MSSKIKLVEFEQERQKKLGQSTPMAESFEEAVELAADVAVAAREDGVTAQIMYCSPQGDEDEDTLLEEAGDLSEQLAIAFAAQGPVQVVLPNDETLNFYAGEWADLPTGVSLRTMPEDASDASLASLLDAGAAFVLLVSPGEAQRPSVERLLALAKERGGGSGDEDGEEGPSVTAVVAVNARWEGVPEGATRTFHLEQVDMVDGVGEPYNTAIITRAYPQAFTVWEENPEDVKAVNGLCFVDVCNEDPEQPPGTQELLKMLETNRKLFKERCKWK